MRRSSKATLSRALLLSGAATLVGAAALVVPAEHVSAQGQGFPTAENAAAQAVPARDPAGHWTPSALVGAEPLPLPIPSESASELIQGAGESQDDPAAQPEGTTGAPRDAAAAGGSGGSAGTPTIANGRNADREVRPDLRDRLFGGSKMGDAQGTGAGSAPRAASELPVVLPLDVGTAGPTAFFSSSQLVPTDARLHYPYRAAGKLFFSQDGRNFICSGAVLRPRLVLTAGHCVHAGSGGGDGFFDNFLFVPAYHDGQAPYQAWNWTWVITTPSWANGGGGVPNAGDWAIIEVEDRRFEGETKRIGDVTGFFGYRTNALNPNHTKKIGYPAGFDNGEVMHQVDSAHSSDGGSNTALYGSDMTGGSSGGPWVENFGIRSVGQTGGLQPEPNRIVGVTSYGFVSPDPKVQGSSVFNDEFLNMLNAACAHREGNC